MQTTDYDFSDIDRMIVPEDIPLKNKADAPNIWREMADKFGVDVVIWTVKKCGGSRIDVPSYKRLSGPALDRDCKRVGSAL